MLREHNTSDNDLPELPQLAIILTGSSLKLTEETQSSVEEQSYKNVTVLHNKEESTPVFFNRLNKEHEIYGFMNSGDTLASEDSLQILVNKLYENKFIGGAYADTCVKQDGLIQELYFPPHDHQTFSKLIGVFPVFFKLEAIKEGPLDENLKYLYGHNTLSKISNNFIISHIPELLFLLTSKQINIQSDIDYLRNATT